MLVAVTGATGFLGRYIVHHLLSQGHRCRCWYRPSSDRGGFDVPGGEQIEWLPGALDDLQSYEPLVRGADAVVHAALDRKGPTFRGGEGDMVSFTERNVVGTIRLIENARRANVGRFVFISTCAVYEKILADRPLDETHPMWPTSHYGAHKAAIEEFIYSYGLGYGYPICALRATGIYGLARPFERSKWYGIVSAVARGEAVHSDRGGKEVHASDVAKAAGLLLYSEGIAGQAYNSYDLYVSEEMVARLAKEITASKSDISNLNRGPQNQIDTTKLRALGMTFGGEQLLRDTVQSMILKLDS